MTILEQAAALAAERLGEDVDGLTVERVVVGLFFTGVKLSDGACGISFTPIKEIPEAVCCPSSAGRAFDPARLPGTPARQLLVSLGDPEPIRMAVAVATLNALSAACWNRGLTGGVTIATKMDAQDTLSFPNGATVVVIGALVPVLRRLEGRAAPWWVVEQDPRTLKGKELNHFVPSTEALAVVQRADVLVATGVTLQRGTLEPMLAVVPAEAQVTVLGPTASMLPEPLFERGVDVVGGVWVRRPDRLLDVLAAAGSGYHFFDTLADRCTVHPAGGGG